MQDAAGKAIWLNYTLVAKTHTLFPLYFMEKTTNVCETVRDKHKRVSFSSFLFVQEKALVLGKQLWPQCNLTFLSTGCNLSNALLNTAFA